MGQNLAAVSGPVKAVHAYVNMLVNMYSLDKGFIDRCVDRSFRSFTLPNGTSVQTCPPAMGELDH